MPNSKKWTTPRIGTITFNHEYASPLPGGGRLLTMKQDQLKQFIVLRESLVQEKAKLLARLAQIDKALNSPAAPAAPTPAAKPGRPAKAAPTAKPAKAKGKGGRRKHGEPGLLQFVRQLTVAKPLAKKEIVEALRKAGRSFTKGYLDVVLYAKGNFKRVDGKFAPPA